MARIKSIEVDGIFGMYDLKWNLRSGVNILSGGNGSGKSTLLRAVGLELLGKGMSYSGAPIDRVVVEATEPQGVRAEDVLIVGRGNSVVIYSDESEPEITRERFALFCDVVGKLFEDGGKRIATEVWREGIKVEDLRFIIHNQRFNRDIEIEYQWLSSGEQLAVSIFWALALRPNIEVLLIDEPEVSLSIEWQKSFIESVLEISGDIQMVIATHSPAIIMRGWVDCVTEIDDLFN